MSDSSLISKSSTASLDHIEDNETTSRQTLRGSFDLPKFFGVFFSPRDDLCSLASDTSSIILSSAEQPQDQHDEQHQEFHEHFRKIQEEMRRARVFTNASARLWHEKILNDCPATKNHGTSTYQTNQDGAIVKLRKLSEVKDALLSFVGNISGEWQTDESSLAAIDYSLSNIQCRRKSNDYERCAGKPKEHQDDRRPRPLKMYSESSLSLSSRTLFSVERGRMVCDFKQDYQNSSVLICDFKKEMNESGLSLDDEEFPSDHHHTVDKHSKRNNASLHPPAMRKRSSKGSRLIRRLSITLQQVEKLIDNLEENNAVDGNREAETTSPKDKDLFTLMREAGAIPCLEKD